MTTTELAAMQSKLASLGIPYFDLKVFGAIRCNVHVRCIGRSTAQKWAQVMAAVFPGTKIALSQTAWSAAENKGTSMRPTKQAGFLIAISA